MTSTKTIAVNRRARYEYDILENYEAGIVLTGTEIKAIREGRANLSDGYVRPGDGELWLENVHIAQYSAANVNSHEPTRSRKLLLHKEEIRQLTKGVSQKGLTAVPLRLYLKRGRAKVELGLARGRKHHDKRRVMIEREREREAREAVGRR